MTVALVTGGGGFLGGAIVDRLLERGWTVRSFARGAYPQLAARGVEVLRGDLADRHAVMRAVAGCDIVFHVAGRAGVGGPRREYRGANVDGTVHVLDACRRFSVGRLVFTSSPSVVHRGGDIAGGDESLPYATRPESVYPATKAVAERLVLAANGDNLLATALRPHLVWGPGDTHLVPQLLARARAGRLRLVGSGRALVDSTYIDNAAHAHLLAADRLQPGAPPAGRAYFISNSEPLPVGDLINRVLRAGGLPPERRRVPYPLAYTAAAAAELTWRVLRRDDDPPLTRFLVRQLATAHWFDLTAARRDLGYTPLVNLEEGFERLAAWLRR